jgi:hypothetical protein
MKSPDGLSPGKLEALALAKLAREPGPHSDGGGLRLTVQSPTFRSWVFSYTLNHTLRSIGARHGARASR